MTHNTFEFRREIRSLGRSPLGRAAYARVQWTGELTTFLVRSFLSLNIFESLYPDCYRCYHGSSRTLFSGKEVILPYIDINADVRAKPWVRCMELFGKGDGPRVCELFEECVGLGFGDVNVVDSIRGWP